MLQTAISTQRTESEISLFGLFPNYAGKATNSFGDYPLSYLELSRPTGRYVSRFLLRQLNILTRRHSILIIGNTCAPGYFFPRLEPNKGLEQFTRDAKKSCGIFIANVHQDQVVADDAVVFEAEPFMILNIRKNWQSFQDYLNDMLSKYRVRANKVFQMSSELQMEKIFADEMETALLQRCAMLLQQTLKEKTLAMNTNLQGILHRFSDHFGPNMQFRMYKKENEIVGFISCSIQNQNLIAWHVGYEANIARETHIYQRMLYDLVDEAIKNNCTCINFGRTATEIKSTLGAEPMPNKFVVFAKNRLMQAGLRYFKRKHYKPAEYTIRRPFKD